MIHALTLGAGLFVLWLLLSGIFEPLFIVLGALSAALTVAVALRMEALDAESVLLRLRPGIVAYWFWLTQEVAVAAWAVSVVILSPRMRLQSQLLRVPCTQKTALGRVIHANSITLTPGTVAVEVEDGRILIHALTARAADTAALAEMDRRVSALEKMP